ncbi:hypothetical protein BC830DRAFT_463589 [Chytriomyces sp. MP71]|nr:hypothetical protein BC830DRAFT_463589 [Chytriomyces sp. MP71]
MDCFFHFPANLPFVPNLNFAGTRCSRIRYYQLGLMKSVFFFALDVLCLVINESAFSLFGLCEHVGWMDGDEVDLLCRTCHQKGNPEKVDSLMLGGEAFAEDPADDLSRSLRRQSVDTSQRGGRGDSLDSAADSDDSAAAETPSGAAPSQAERKRQKNRRAQTAYVERKRALTQSLESQLSGSFPPYFGWASWRLGKKHPRVNECHTTC